MDEEDAKLCTNCKREIPAVNYTIHSVHCARNIRPCPVCKEPVPVAQLAQHHDALHKEVPCKKCGESVCGTDLEDHVRDSCAETIKPCRYCELELPRGALPAHEAYCGARSEQCACGEYVMAKYRQLHLDSNHGFIRLHEDPAPPPTPKPKPNGLASATTAAGAARRPATEIRHFDPGDNRLAEARSSNGGGDWIPEAGTSSTGDNRLAEGSNGYIRDRIQRGFNGSGDMAETRLSNGARAPKRNNDQPQVNTSVQPVDKVNKELPARGAVKKRAAPPPPPPPDARRDLALASAARRLQLEERRRREQSARNLAAGLPPVLSAAAKLDKLRKMDALHNRELDARDYKNCLQGRVWQPADVPTGHVLGSGPRVGGVGPDLSHLQPMTPAQFMNRFEELRLGAGGGDRFDQIKSSLRELRRGLNEVTAPYNTPPNASNSDIDGEEPYAAPEDDDLRLPCEFCALPVPADELVLHQTGCRPELARVPARAARVAPLAARVAPLEPVIPCEFCAETLPLYLINDHQENCGLEANALLYPD